MVRAYDIRTGAVMWTDKFDRAGQFDFAVHVVVGGGRVFVAGITNPAAGNDDDFTVRAYNAQTGALDWEDTFDYGGLDEAFAIAVGGGRVVAIGGGVNASGNEDIILRAYDANNGTVLWTRIVDQGADEEGQFLAIHGGRVFMAALGNGGETPCVASISPAALNPPGAYRGDCDFLVRAYDLATGKLVWSNQMNIGGDFDVAYYIAVDGSTVAAVGIGTPYGSTCQPDVGAGGNCDWLVRMYDARTGFPLWGDLFDRDPAPGGFDQASRVAIEGRRIFVTGFTAAPGSNCTNPFTTGGNCDFTLRAYDIRTGGILWQRFFDLAGGFDLAGPIDAKDGRVVAAGRGQVNSVFPTNVFSGPYMDWLVRTYDARTGALLWKDQFDYASGHDRVAWVAIQGRRVVAVGRSANNSTGDPQSEDWLVRTYER